MIHGEFPAAVADLNTRQLRLLLGKLTPSQKWWVLHHWPNWACTGQRAPEGDWRTWVLMAGRGFGKTRAGAEWVAEQVQGREPVKIALVGATLDEARKVMVEGQSGLRSVADHLIKAWHPSKRLLEFTNGSEATLFSGASPEAFRGPEHHVAWCDEMAKWKQEKASWDMLQMGLRLGERPRALVTTTPRGGSLLKELLAKADTVLTGGATYANPHLPAAFLETMAETFGGTRLGRQEIEGELLTDQPGALWTPELLTRAREAAAEPHAPFVKVAVGVDPPSGDGTCGIVACALDTDGVGHVLADHSVSESSPERWAAVVAEAAAIHGARAPEGATKVVAEINQGGKMVVSVLRNAAPALNLRTVTARAGKALRAEPVALLFEAGRVRLHGRFPEMEAQLLGLIAGGGYEGPGDSPDRADAMVWALTELMVGGRNTPPRVLGL